MTPGAIHAHDLRRRGRKVFSACLKCAQALAPDWPLLMLWPWLRLSLSTSLAHLSRSRRRRRISRGSHRLVKVPARSRSAKLCDSSR